MNTLPRPYLHKIDTSNRWVDAMIEDRVIFRRNMFSEAEYLSRFKNSPKRLGNIDVFSRASCSPLFCSFFIKFYIVSLSLSLIKILQKNWMTLDQSMVIIIPVSLNPRLKIGVYVEISSSKF